MPRAFSFVVANTVAGLALALTASLAGVFSPPSNVAVSPPAVTLSVARPTPEPPPALSLSAHERSLELLAEAVPLAVAPPPPAPAVNLYVAPPPPPPVVTPEPRVVAARYDERYATFDEVRVAAATAGLVPGEALGVSRCEAGVDLDADLVKDHVDLKARGSHGEVGPMQIHPIHYYNPENGRYGLVHDLGYTLEDMERLGPAMRVSRAIKAVQGWWGWSCGYAAYAG